MLRGTSEAEPTSKWSTPNVENEEITSNLGWILYSVYAVLGVCWTWCMLYSVYAVLGVCCTRCMLYSVYSVLGVCCTQCQLMIMKWRDWKG